MPDAHWHIFSYDIRDDRRRRKAARHLEGYGERVQQSVFRIHCTPRQLIRIRWELVRILATDDDLLIIPIPDAVAKRIHTRDLDNDWTAEADIRWRIVG